MFPGAHSTIYRNEVGEVLGWDEPEYPGERDIDDFYAMEDEYDDSDEDDDSVIGDEDDDSYIEDETGYWDASRSKWVYTRDPDEQGAEDEYDGTVIGN